MVWGEGHPGLDGGFEERENVPSELSATQSAVTVRLLCALHNRSSGVGIDLDLPVHSGSVTLPRSFWFGFAPESQWIPSQNCCEMTKGTHDRARNKHICDMTIQRPAPLLVVGYFSSGLGMNRIALDTLGKWPTTEPHS